ncbi:MAG TPA: DUF2892 domain-containing protein [Deltaproteobacteria bacterium]|nr:DUF2892 domain-containing protein [Deltaproteobacteria bacterium]
MEQNVGVVDRLVRFGTALFLIFILVKTSKASVLSAVLLVTSGALISSASSGYCPLCTHLGMTTASRS